MKAALPLARTRRAWPVLGALVAFGAVHAAEERGENKEPAVAASEAKEPAASEAKGPVTTAAVSAGIGVSSGDAADRALFGQYNGLRTHGTVGLFGVEYSWRDPLTGNVVLLEGTDLLLETRELGVRWKHPGDWKLGADYSELVRYDPLSTGSGADFHTKRTRLGLARLR